MYNYAPAGPEILERVEEDRGGVRPPQGPASRRRAAISARPSDRRLDHPGAVAGAQVEKNVAAFRHPIPADFWAELKHEKLIRAEAPTPA